MDLRVKRVYAEHDENDGLRVLVDGVWPRGMRKDESGVDLWIREVAPSKELRQWFGHDPDRWEEFRRRYFRELDGKEESVSRLLQAVRGRRATLLFAARDTRHNNAVALKEYLEARTGPR
jgi:uncharacterized protein YeaO (DUF488 family)